MLAAAEDDILHALLDARPSWSFDMGLLLRHGSWCTPCIVVDDIHLHLHFAFLTYDFPVIRRYSRDVLVRLHGEDVGMRYRCDSHLHYTHQRKGLDRAEEEITGRDRTGYVTVTSMQMRKSCSAFCTFPSLGRSPVWQTIAMPTPCHQVANTMALKLMNLASGLIACSFSCVAL